jgi:hypothetical protein
MPELMETQAIRQSGSLEQRLEVPALDILGLLRLPHFFSRHGLLSLDPLVEPSRTGSTLYHEGGILGLKRNIFAGSYRPLSATRRW